MCGFEGESPAHNGGKPHGVLGWTSSLVNSRELFLGGGVSWGTKLPRDRPQSFSERGLDSSLCLDSGIWTNPNLFEPEVPL